MFPLSSVSRIACQSNSANCIWGTPYHAKNPSLGGPLQRKKFIRIATNHQSKNIECTRPTPKPTKKEKISIITSLIQDKKSRCKQQPHHHCKTNKATHLRRLQLANKPPITKPPLQHQSKCIREVSLKICLKVSFVFLSNRIKNGHNHSPRFRPPSHQCFPHDRLL